MKKLLIAVFLFPLITSAQKNDSTGRSGHTGAEFIQLIIGNGESQMRFYDDGTLAIRGDTAIAARTVLKIILDCSREKDSILHVKDSTIRVLWKTMEAGVQFLNHVPPYLLSKAGNPKWSAYWSLLTKNGYFMKNMDK